MSGPVGAVDASPTDAQASAVKPACVEITPSREAVVGAMRVRRALPRIGRRTVGAWCFADHMGPELVTETRGLDIGPHPHTGLQTVTWLVAGEVLHRDSLVPAAAARTRRVGVGHGAARAHRPAHRIGPARPAYLDGLIMTVQAPEELSRCRSGRGRRLSDRGRGAHQRCRTRLGPDGPGRLAWRRTGRQGSHSLSSSSACLVRGAVDTCSCWNRNRSAVLSLTDSVWLPAANTTISCWSTSGST